ncbi:MAG: zinc-dependent alcohol dehydrogenase [Planctomycetota bacterium]|jgi:threonine dehydrogenase-like Zn-dependent dehydrogenase
MDKHGVNSMKTRQAWLVQPGKFELKEAEISVGHEDILVKVRACGLCNWELNHWKGLLGPYPQTMGHEVAGTVVCVGSDVPEGFVYSGQKIAGWVNMIGFADYTLMNYKYCMRLENRINLEEALAEPLMCVTTTLRGATPDVGDIGVIVGCGPMGLWCIQGLAGQSLAALIAIDINNERLALAQKYGATHTINPQEVDNVVEIIKEISKEHMADFVIEGTGRPSVLNSCVDYLKVGRGRLIMMSSHEEPCTFFDWRRAQKGIEIRVTHPSYSLAPSDDVRRASLLLHKGTFDSKEIVSHRFAYENIEEAFLALENKRSNYMKGIVVLPE